MDKDDIAKHPLEKPLPWLSIGASAAVAGALAAVVLSGILNRIVNNGCTGECLTRTDTAMQAHMALAAWGVLTISIVSGAASLFLIWRTLLAAQRSARAAERTLAETRRLGEAQVRAYLTVTSAMVKVYDDDLGAYCEFTIFNSGQSPALRVSAKGQLTVQSWGELQVETLWTEQSAGESYSDIPAGSPGTGGLMFVPMDVGAKPTIHDGRARYSFTQFDLEFDLRFEDVFGEERVEHFGFHIPVPDEKDLSTLTAMHFAGRPERSHHQQGTT